MPEPRFRVLITEPIHPSGTDRLARQTEVINLPDRPGETIDQHLPIADAVIVRTARLDAVRLAHAPRLKMIGKHGVGIDNIDLVAARERGIIVTSTPGANAQAVAEHALTLMLLLARRIPTVSRLLREGHFEAARGTALASDLFRKTLGLVGVGNVGARLAVIARTALAMPVLAFDPYVRPEHARELGVDLVDDLAILLRSADVISIHTPLTPETRGLIDSTALALLKPSAILINCARGGIVDEAALLVALRKGQLAGAGLDVFASEPVPIDHPLLQCENVIATPHVAGASQEAFATIAQTVAEDVLRVLHGEPPIFPVRGVGS